MWNEMEVCWSYKLEYTNLDILQKYSDRKTFSEVMASCELDYRLSSKLQSSNSEEIEDDGDSSDDEVELDENGRIWVKMKFFWIEINSFGMKMEKFDFRLDWGSLRIVRVETISLPIALLSGEHFAICTFLAKLAQYVDWLLFQIPERWWWLIQLGRTRRVKLS